MEDYDQNTDIYQRWSKTDSVYSLLEWYVFLKTIGSVKGLDVLDVACGEGRLSRLLMKHGARSVVGVDISSEMIARAEKENLPGGSEGHYDALRYEIVSAADEAFMLDHPVALVTALYLFHYAASEEELDRMCRFIGRNTKAGGRVVTYGINPDHDFENQRPEMAKLFGFHYRTVAPPEYALIIGDFEVPIWQWSRRAHEDGLADAGFVNIHWHPLALPPAHRDLAPSVQWYLDNPSCIVLEAEKPSA